MNAYKVNQIKVESSVSGGPGGTDFYSCSYSIMPPRSTKFTFTLSGVNVYHAASVGDQNYVRLLATAGVKIEGKRGAA
jgi:hypothetical protein